MFETVFNLCVLIGGGCLVAALWYAPMTWIPFGFILGAYIGTQRTDSSLLGTAIGAVLGLCGGLMVGGVLESWRNPEKEQKDEEEEDEEDEEENDPAE